MEDPPRAGGSAGARELSILRIGRGVTGLDSGWDGGMWDGKGTAVGMAVRGCLWDGS